MIESDASKPPSPASRYCLIALIALSALLVVGIPYLNEQKRVSLELQKAEWRQNEFNRVKNGAQDVLIMDSRLLPMLAQDADCIANAQQLKFSMTEITPDDARFISQLTNVKTLYFYDTHGAELVLENALDLPIGKMGFEMDRLSKDALRKLSDFPVLTDVHFEHVMYPDEIALLEKLPPRITVHIPHPAVNEPGYKERGEPSDAPGSPSSR